MRVHSPHLRSHLLKKRKLPRGRSRRSQLERWSSSNVDVAADAEESSMRPADAKGARNPNWFERAVKDVQQKLHEHFPRSPNPPAEGAPGAARARDLAARYGDDHAPLDTLPSAYEVGEDVSFSERWDARDSARDSWIVTSFRHSVRPNRKMPSARKRV